MLLAPARGVVSNGGRKIWVLSYFALLIFGLVVVTIDANLMDPLIYQYTPDSSGYIEQARIFLAEFQFPASRLFPPGYPLLIAAAGAMGIEPSNAALWLPRLFYALVPVAVTFSLSTVLTRWAAIAVAVLVSLSPGLLSVGVMALSDVVFFVLIVAGFGLLLRCVERAQLSCGLLSGLLLGFAYTLRNGGLAAFLSVGASLFAASLLGIIDKRKSVSPVIGLAVGTAIPVLPLLTYNFMEFGQLLPYSMAPSEVAFLTNLRLYISQAILDITASRNLAAVAWDIRLFLLCFGMLSGLFLWLTWNRWNQFREIDKFALLLFLAYAGAGASMVVLARTKYQWGEMINLRHVMQYSWLVLSVLAMLLVGNKKWTTKTGVYLFAGLIALLLTLRFYYIQTTYSRELSIQQRLNSVATVLEAETQLPRSWVLSRQLKRIVADKRELMSMINAIEIPALIASNMADVIRIESARSVQTFESGNNVLTLELNMNRLLQESNGDMPLHLFLFPTNSLLRNGVWGEILSHTPNCNFSIVKISHDFVWLRSRIVQDTGCSQ